MHFRESLDSTFRNSIEKAFERLVEKTSIRHFETALRALSRGLSRSLGSTPRELSQRAVERLVGKASIRHLETILRAFSRGLLTSLCSTPRDRSFRELSKGLPRNPRFDTSRQLSDGCRKALSLSGLDSIPQDSSQMTVEMPISLDASKCSLVAFVKNSLHDCCLHGKLSANVLMLV